MMNRPKLHGLIKEKVINMSGNSNNATHVAYQDFMKYLKSLQGKEKDRFKFGYKEKFDVVSWGNYLLAESIFNRKYRKGRHTKSTVTFRDIE